jgi:hypothetical protein
MNYPPKLRHYLRCFYVQTVAFYILNELITIRNIFCAPQFEESTYSKKNYLDI